MFPGRALRVEFICVVWQAGGYATASALYKEALQVLRDSEAPLEEVAKRTEMVVMFL